MDSAGFGQGNFIKDKGRRIRDKKRVRGGEKYRDRESDKSRESWSSTASRTSETLMAKDFKDQRWDCPIRKSNITVRSFSYIIPGELTCS